MKVLLVCLIATLARAQEVVSGPNDILVHVFISILF